MAGAWVQGSGTQTGFGGAAGIAFGSAVTAGNAIVVACSMATGTATASISDNQGNSYTLVGGAAFDAPGPIRMYLWVAANVAGGSTTVTITPSTSIVKQIHLAEVSGLATSSPIDQSATGSGSSVTSVTTSATGTTAQANEYLVAFCATSQDKALTANASYTSRTTTVRTMLEDRNVSSTGTYTANFTWTGSTNGGCILATLKEAAAGSFTGTGAVTISHPSVAGTGAFSTTGSGAVSVGAPAIAGTGTFATTGSGSVSIGPPSVAGAGDFAVTGSGAATIGAPSIAGEGAFATTGSGGVVIGPPSVAGSGADMAVGDGALTIGAPALDGAGTFDLAAITGTGTVTIGAPMLDGAGTFSAGVITGTGAIIIRLPRLFGASAVATRATASDAAYGGGVGRDLAYAGAVAGAAAHATVQASDQEG